MFVIDIARRLINKFKRKEKDKEILLDSSHGIPLINIYVINRLKSIIEESNNNNVVGYYEMKSDLMEKGIRDLIQEIEEVTKGG